jgi:hypothetical protein
MLPVVASDAAAAVCFRSAFLLLHPLLLLLLRLIQLNLALLASFAAFGFGCVCLAGGCIVCCTLHWIPLYRYGCIGCCCSVWHCFRCICFCTRVVCAFASAASAFVVASAAAAAIALFGCICFCCLHHFTLPLWRGFAASALWLRRLASCYCIELPLRLSVASAVTAAIAFDSTRLPWWLRRLLHLASAASAFVVASAAAAAVSV